MDNDQESVQFWNSLLQSLADSSPKDDLYPEISRSTLATCTPMTIDEPAHDPWNFFGDHGDKEIAAAEKTAAEDGDTNMNEVGESSTTQRAMEKEKEEDIREDTKTLSKIPRGKEARSISDKKKRIDIRNKVDTLKELTRCHSKKDLFSSLEAVVDSVRELKFYVESCARIYASTMPQGMEMDFQAPCNYPYAPPNYVSPDYFMPFHNFTPGETSGHGNNQIVPYANQLPSLPSQFQPPSQPSQSQPQYQMMLTSQPHYQPQSSKPM